MANGTMDQDDLQKNYDDLINAVFEATYDDLIVAFRKRNRALKKIRSAETEHKRKDAEFDLRCAEKKIDFYVDWLRAVLPQWRDLDANKIIDRAEEVARETD